MITASTRVAHRCVHDDAWSPRCRRGQGGFLMMEVLIALIVVLAALLGLAKLQAKTQQGEMESYQRSQALVLMQDIIDRMNANRTDAHDRKYVTAGVGGGGSLVDCGGKAGADLDLCEWGNALRGSSEIAGGGACTTSVGAGCVGAMIGARGCIAYDATSELTDSSGGALPGTGIYIVTVAWQGLFPTAAPVIGCGKFATDGVTSVYGNDLLRRVITTTLRTGALAGV